MLPSRVIYVLQKIYEELKNKQSQGKCIREVIGIYKICSGYGSKQDHQIKSWRQRRTKRTGEC